MSQNKDDKSTPQRPAMGASGDAGLPKRPVPIIDLKATEIKPETKPAAGASGSAGAGTSASASASISTGKSADIKSSDAKPGVGAAAASVPNIDPKSTAKPGAGIDGTKIDQAKPPAAATTRPGSTVPPTSSSGTSASGSVAKGSAPVAVAHAAAPKAGLGIGRALSYLSAAVLGGLLAIFGADFMASSLGIDVRSSSPVGPAVEDLSARLKKLEQSTAQAPVARPDTGALKGVADQLTQANERLAKLEGANRQLTALSEAQSKLVETTRALETRIGEGAPAEAAGRLAKLEESMQGLAAMAQAQPGRPLPEMARISTKLGEIETAVAALRKGGGGGEVTAQIEARLAEARKAEAQMNEAVTQLKAESTKRLREIEAVKTQSERLEQRVEVDQDRCRRRQVECRRP